MSLIHRPRRMRQNAVLRQMVRESRVMRSDLIYPIFIKESGAGPIASMPGIRQYGVEELKKEAKEIKSLGIPAVLLFGIPDKKDEQASGAYASDGIVQKAIAELKSSVPDLYVITDVCLCEYMSHGHCGLVKDGQILNDPSLDLLSQTALSHAKAGADMVAPSDMMDGRVRAIRHALDASGFLDLPIMSYAVKYASAFYGPFRDAAGSAPQFGDRQSYQMDPANAREGLKEAFWDIDEGADILMVKPAMSYLDIVYRVKQETRLPVAAYQVSGEYAMIKAAAQNGWVDENRIVLETLLSIKRAGADLIVSYFAKQVASLLP